MPPPDPTTRRVLYACIGLMLLGQTALGSSVYLNHDVAWSLTAAGRVLEGATLYEDLLEINPPLFIVLATPAAWIAKHTAISAPVLLLVFVNLVALSSLVSTARLLDRLALPLRRGAEILLAALAFVLVPVALPLFGQREHLFALFWTPYVFAAAVRASGAQIRPAHAAWIGAFAGLGIALKPFFVLPYLGVEAYLAFHGRRLRLRTETVAAAAVVAGYVAAVLTVWPGYFGTIVPLARSTYWAYNNPLLEVLTRMPALVALAGLALGGVLRVNGTPWRALRGPLWASTAGSLMAALIQSKGWNYQLYPALVTGSLLLVVVATARLAERWRDRSLPSASAWALPAALVVATMGAWAAGWSRLEFMHREATALVPVLRECGGAGSVAFLSTDIDPAFPAVTYTDLRWTFRYAALWPLPAIVRQRHAEAAGGAVPERPPVDAPEAFLVETVVADLEQVRPDLLVVDKRRHKQALDRLPFDFVEYFSRDERFRAVMAEYHLLRQVARHDIYGRRTSTRCPALTTSPR